MSEDLARLKARRRELIREYGSLGEKHPMGRMIGGLNPAATELHSLRGQIERIEATRRAPKPVLREIPGRRSGYGLKYDVSFAFHEGKIGVSSDGKWYVVVGGEIVADNLATKGKASDAFAKWTKR